MRESARKWGRRLVRLVVLLVAGYGALKTADLVWFRAFVPIAFQNANWVGTWHTNQYGLSGHSKRSVSTCGNSLPTACRSPYH
jgi:hypothetical protein